MREQNYLDAQCLSTSFTRATGSFFFPTNNCVSNYAGNGSESQRQKVADVREYETKRISIAMEFWWGEQSLGAQ